MELPKLTEEPIMYVDMTPDNGFVLRILRAYRQNCDCMWSDNMGGEDTKNPVFVLMNNANRERAKLLDNVIHILENGHNV